MATGIEPRHARTCRSRRGGRCDCEPTYRAHIWDGARKERHRRTFKSEAQARSWRRDTRIALRRGRQVEKASSDGLKSIAEAWLEGARTGTIRTRSGDIYKPAAVRSYEAALRLRLYPTYENEPLADIRRVDLQELVEKWLGEGLAPSTIEATLIPLRSIFRREVSRGRIALNPLVGLELPKGETPRDRIADPKEAAKLLAAVPEADRPVWATAMYAGLRRGELRALRANRVDVDAGLVRVEYGWDDLEGEIDTKGRNRRNVPIPTVLREHLLGQLMRSGRRDDELLFGRSERAPFDYRRMTDRADEAWKTGKLKRITFHECRHTYASFMIAAGVNAKALSTYMGHGNIGITLDRYGHLMPGNEEEAAGLLDAYLTKRVAEAAR